MAGGPSETAATRPRSSAAAIEPSALAPLTPTQAAPPGTDEASRPGRSVVDAVSARRTSACQPSMTPYPSTGRRLNGTASRGW